MNKILDTNEKVDITYIDFNGKTQSKTSDVTPKLKLTEPPKILPNAGKPIFIVLSIGIVGISAYSFIRYNITRNNMKH